MINNLFSIFDPSSRRFRLNWLSVLLPFIFTVKTFYYSNRRFLLMFIIFKNSILKDLNSNIKKTNKTINIFLLSLIIIICVYNLLRLFPFIFATTAHISIRIAISLPVWIILFIFNWMHKPLKTLTHLVPTGTPLILCPFMVIIETIRNIIRPLTLSIRLSANIIAGHILILLLRSQINNVIYIFLLSSIMINLLIILELAVAIIQGYVFITLISLYLNEI